MRSRFLWFAVGVGLTVFVVAKGKKLYDQFTPAGIKQNIDKAGEEFGSRVRDFIDTFNEARQEREAELNAALNLDVVDV